MASLARCISQFELAALQKKDWKAFARLYNGPAYAQNRYDEKLSTAFFFFLTHKIVKLC